MTTNKRGRPKGSKNEFSKKQIAEMQERINELEKQSNSYEQTVNNFVDGFILELSENIKTINNETLQKWFSNPDSYMEKIQDLLTYYYIIDGNISQLYDLIFSLPQLTYQIKTLKRLDSYEDDIFKIKQVLEKKINHKTLTRTLLIQLAHQGTVLGMWMGNKKEPYYQIFNDLKYVYPYGVYQGKMIGVFDLECIDEYYNTEQEKKDYCNSLKPFLNYNMYKKWKNCTDTKKKEELQLIVLPPEISLVARNRILSNNQRLGLPMGTQAIFDLQHKQKLKNLERAIADKIIRALAVIKMKDKDDNDNTVKESVQKRVFTQVKKVLEKNTNSEEGLTCIGLPSWANFEYPEIKNADKVLTSDKYENVNDDISMGIGMSKVFGNGTGGNYSSANLNLDTIYKKIGSMLEQIEEIYNQLITIILGKSKGNNYLFEYEKSMPLTNSDKLKTLTTLESQGYAVKPLLNMLGIDYEDYINQSLYEIENQKLREKIIPPKTSYTTSGKEEGNPSGDTSNETNDNTILNKELDGNSNPKPSTS